MAPERKDVLVVGGGGREHALVWKLAQSPRVGKIYCAPGNAGIGELAECVPLAADDVKGLTRFALERKIGLTVVGPELPLTLGIVDEFELNGLKIFGPTSAAAQLEASKAFAKELLRQNNVPTAYFGVFTDPDEASTYVREVGAPIVVKADGLAAGKGVVICKREAEAIEAIDEIMRARCFGDAGRRVVVEEFLEGEELSFMAVTDGSCVVPLATSQDHKRAFDADQGPNTGGMGAYSPAAIASPELTARIMDEIMLPVAQGLKKKKIKYKGVLYAGLMICEGRPKVLEFNVRFGDPECQAILPRLRSDLFDLLEATVEERLAGCALQWDSGASVCVILASEGYPGDYARGRVISGLEDLAEWKGGVVFHAGTKKDGDRVLTNGGRVLGVTGIGRSFREAIEEAYRAVGLVKFKGMHFRTDIGQRAISASAERE